MVTQVDKPQVNSISGLEKETPAIEVQELTKSFQTYSRREGVLGSIKDLFHREYRTVFAVNRISFQVQPGELLGYIGPNGAGKSTSIKMLTGILKPSSGSVSVLGMDPFKDRRRYTKEIGVVFGQRTQLWWDIAVLESFKLLAKIYRVSDADFRARLEELSEVLALRELLHTPVRKLSLGQRMRCDLAASLIHRPSILFLDEPTIGLDTVAKDSIRTFLRYINKQFRTTIILTTHDLKEIEELCERILVIDQGKVIYDGLLEQVRSMSGLHHVLELEFPHEAPLMVLRELFEDRMTFEKKGERQVIAKYDPNELPTTDVLREILDRFEVNDLSVRDPDIDEVIMRLYRQGHV